MDLASDVAALASVGVRVSGSTPNNNIQEDSSRACPTGLAGPEPSGTHNDPGQHFQEVCNFDWLYDHYGVKTHFVPQIAESYPAQSVPLEASTRKGCFGRRKLHPRRDSFCNSPPHTCGDPVIIWSFGNLIACTITMGSKHTSFPKLKNQASPKVCPWKRQLARSVLGKRNSIRGGTRFAITPFKRPEMW